MGQGGGRQDAHYLQRFRRGWQAGALLQSKIAGPMPSSSTLCLGHLSQTPHSAFS